MPAKCFMESVLDIFRGPCYDDNVKQALHFKIHMKGCERLKNRLEELAAALEVTRQTIGSLENGRYNPSILLAFKLSRYFGLPIEEIFIYEEGEAT